MNINTKIYLKKKFQEYYSKNKVPAPREIEKREFGVGNLEKKIQIRHKSFPDELEMQNYLKREAPFFISYSTAYYEFPSNEPMIAKNWLYADLVFDLDMPMDLLNAEKLRLVKNEVINLRDFLLNDFGFSQQDIAINFSGSKGYHTHVFSEKVKNLGSDERREIVDFISGNVTLDELWYPRGEFLMGPKKEEKGWKGKIWEKLYDILKNSDKNSLKSLPSIGEKKAQLIYQHRDRILSDMEKGIYDLIATTNIISLNTTDARKSVYASKTLSRSYRDPNIKVAKIPAGSIKSPLIQRIIQEKAVKAIASIDADKIVTIDTSRLIRLPNTLHGGSGLVAKKVSNIDTFNPLEHATAFGSEQVTIKLEQEVPKFDFSQGVVGPFDEGIIKVPESLAVYLLLRGHGSFLQA